MKNRRSPLMQQVQAVIDYPGKLARDSAARYREMLVAERDNAREHALGMRSRLAEMAAMLERLERFPLQDGELLHARAQVRAEMTAQVAEMTDRLAAEEAHVADVETRLAEAEMYAAKIDAQMAALLAVVTIARGAKTSRPAKTKHAKTKRAKR